MTIKELTDQAKQANCQPYYWAYCLATKAASPDAARQRDGTNADYIEWISRQWTITWQRLHIRNRLESKLLYQNDLLQTLVNTIKETT